MGHRFQKLSTLDFKKVDIGLHKTELISAYSQLKFNGGFVLATIESNDPEKFKDYLEFLYPSQDEWSMGVNTRPAAENVKDFIYHLLGNESLADLEIYLGNGEEFLTIDPPYNSLDKFRKLGFTELSKKELEKRLFIKSIAGSIYDDWKISNELTLEMINDFTNQLFLKGDQFRSIYFEQWGNFMIGLFEGFIFLNIDKGQLTFFAIDDYD